MGGSLGAVWLSRASGAPRACSLGFPWASGDQDLTQATHGSPLPSIQASVPAAAAGGPLGTEDTDTVEVQQAERGLSKASGDPPRG